MSSSEFTLSQFFSVKADDLAQTLSREDEPSESDLSVRASLTKEVPQIGWAETVSGVLEKFDELLNIRITDIMVSAWNKYRALREYSNKEKYSPNETILVPLAEHTIASEHHPFIEILKNDRRIAKIEFTVNIVLKLEGCILKLQDGKIKEIRTGNIKGKGTVKYGKAVILNRDIASISLPGSIDLGEGVAIQGSSPSRIEAPTRRAAPTRPAKPEKQAERRKDKRLEMNVPILVLGPKGEQEIARTKNVSEGGLAVSLAMKLNVGDVLRIVCPYYTPADQDIEERTEVRHLATSSIGGRLLYGLRYLR